MGAGGAKPQNGIEPDPAPFGIPGILDTVNRDDTGGNPAGTAGLGVTLPPAVGIGEAAAAMSSHNGLAAASGGTNMASAGSFAASADTKITQSRTIGLYLNPILYKTPIAIERGVSITNPNFPSAVYTKPDQTVPFAIENSGTIVGTTNGIYLSRCSVTNMASGYITSTGTAAFPQGYGIEIATRAGTVVNYGTLAGKKECRSRGWRIGYQRGFRYDFSFV